jgi:hypothetical protein
MGQINFIKGLIGEKLSLRAQFGLHWENFNFRRPNLIFTKSIDSKFNGQLRVKLHKSKTKY